MLLTGYLPLYLSLANEEWILYSTSFPVYCLSPANYLSHWHCAPCAGNIPPGAVGEAPSQFCHPKGDLAKFPHRSSCEEDYTWQYTQEPDKLRQEVNARYHYYSHEKESTDSLLCKVLMWICTGKILVNDPEPLKLPRSCGTRHRGARAWSPTLGWWLRGGCEGHTIRGGPGLPVLIL